MNGTGGQTMRLIDADELRIYTDGIVTVFL